MMSLSLFDEEDKQQASTLTLSGFEALIRNTLNSDPQLRDRWITAQVGDARVSGGHVYMELSEKDAAGQTLAKIRATIWRGVVVNLRTRYREAFDAAMTNGTEVRIKVSVNFHVLFGLSLNITDIDPEYRRDTSRLQAEILTALAAEGIKDANKQLEMPYPPMRVAVISSSGAAGYGDFMNQLRNNPAGLKFHTRLFEAVMQGNQVSATVRRALEMIELRADLFDCVVIIRGGGATSDLAGFDDLQLARAVATCMLPVVVGIGHERDNTVLDFIAHTRVKTPTAAAEWLVAQGEEALGKAVDLASEIARYASNRLTGERRMLEFVEEKIPLLTTGKVNSARSRLAEISSAMPMTVRNRILSSSAMLERALAAVQTTGRLRLSRESSRLDNARAVLSRDTSVVIDRQRQLLQRLESLIEVLSPQSVLRRGYTITRVGGKALTDVASLTYGSTIETTFASGTVTSTVTNIES